MIETLAEDFLTSFLFSTADGSGVLFSGIPVAGRPTIGHIDIASGEITPFPEILENTFDLEQSNAGHAVYTATESSLALEELFAIRLESDETLRFADWLASFGLDANAIDIDGDGLLEVVEFLFGTAPDTPDGNDQQVAGVVSSAGLNFPTFEFPRIASAVLDVTVEHSTDLQNWTAIATNIGSGQRLLPILGRCVLSESDGEVRVRGIVSLESAPRQQFRIRVSER